MNSGPASWIAKRSVTSIANSSSKSNSVSLHDLFNVIDNKINKIGLSIDHRFLTSHLSQIPIRETSQMRPIPIIFFRRSVNKGFTKPIKYIHNGYENQENPLAGDQD